MKPDKRAHRGLSNEPKNVEKLQKGAKRAFIPALSLRSRNCAARERKESAEKMRVSLPFGVFRRFWARWKALDELFCLV